MCRRPCETPFLGLLIKKEEAFSFYLFIFLFVHGRSYILLQRALGMTPSKSKVLGFFRNGSEELVFFFCFVLVFFYFQSPKSVWKEGL